MSTPTPEYATIPVFGRLAPHCSRAQRIVYIAEAARQIRIQDRKRSDLSEAFDRMGVMALPPCQP